MHWLAEQAGLQTDLSDSELADVAHHLNFAFSIGFVGQRRNDRATAATGEVLRWVLGLHHTTVQQRIGLGFGEGSGPDHRFSACRYLAHTFGHESMPEVTRAAIRRAAERLGVSPDASPAELVRIVYERADDMTTILGALSGLTAAIATVAPRSKPETDEAIHKLFDDLLAGYEAAYGILFGVSNRPRSTSDSKGSRGHRPAGPAMRWVDALFDLCSTRAASAGPGASEIAELAHWAKSRRDGVWRAIHAARVRKMQSENH